MGSKLREYMWLVAFLLCIITGIHQTYKEGFGKSYVFFVFAIFALLFYFVRNRMRKNGANKQSK